MFLFECCTSVDSSQSYQIRQNYEKVTKKEQKSNLQQVINNSNKYVIKTQLSNYKNLLKSSQKFTDLQFPPSKQFLGNLPQFSVCNWKRLGEIVTRPSLFNLQNFKSSEISQILRNNIDDPYFVSAISSILEQPNKIKDIFVSQQYNKQGLYCVRIRVDGVVKQVVVDDYVPVNQLQKPIFSSPSNSQIWIPILEKAWAKINGSYANIVNGSPAQVLKALTFAPSQTFFLQNKPQKVEKLWKLLCDAVKRKSPVCCSTSIQQSIEWRKVNLITGHRYILLYAAQVLHQNKTEYRVVKLRNPKGNAVWEGKGSINDLQFWNKIPSSHQKKQLTQHTNSKVGQFTILFTEFVKYFLLFDISYQLEQGNFVAEQIFINGKNGSLWNIQVTHQGQYCFELHQASLRNKSLQNQDYSRSTLLLAQITKQNTYEFVCGAMRLAQQDTLISTRLHPGTYILYTKFDVNQATQSLIGSKPYILNCYSNKLCKFQLTQKLVHPDFLQKVFLNYGRKNKRQFYNNNKMWISWKLLFKQCGFAYIAFGNHQSSDKMFSISYSSKDFAQMNYKLKTPFKVEKDSQSDSNLFYVRPGQEKIILCRVVNSKQTTLKFPPPIDMKIEEVSNDIKV